MNTHPQILVLKNLQHLLEHIPTETYIQKTKVLANGTIGEHVRHIIEFYQPCLKASQNNSLNYSLRQRDHELEVDTKKGVRETKKIIKQLEKVLMTVDKKVMLHTASTKEASSYQEVKSSLQRELVYCMDHCIHHQFIIRTALVDMHYEHILPENFGVAFSTLEYRTACAS